MKKIIKLTEQDLEKIIKKVLQEQFLPALIPTTIKKTSEMYNKWGKFSNIIRPKIEEMGKKLFPANSMGKEYRKVDLEYRILKDREDAYCHQLASAMIASMFGGTVSSMIGKSNEWYGALRIFFKGAPGKNVPKFSTLDAGYSEDVANNNLGIEIAKKYPNKSLEFYSNEVVKNINNKNYYDNTGKKYKQSTKIDTYNKTA